MPHGKGFIQLSSSGFCFGASASIESSIAQPNGLPPMGESSDQSRSILKEHDYIGLSEVSSIKAGVPKREDSGEDLNFAETDLRLGLGPVEDNGKDAKNVGRDATRNAKSATNNGTHRVNIVSPPHGFQPATATSVPVQEVSVPQAISAHNLARFVSAKNGVKRGYTEAMAERRSEITGGTSMVKAGNGDPKHQQGAFVSKRAPPKAVSMTCSNWSVRLDHTGMAYPSIKTGTPMAAEKLGVSGDSPPLKGAVIGWPPIGPCRKNSLTKPAEMFVKVNMDGITVGRKVDLNAHSSYEGLLSALEDMFQPSCNGMPHSNGDLKLFESEFILTYEDKDGDWMLVGDVPWSMFINTVRRLRIMRGSDAVNLDLCGHENLNCHA